jgi:hypothetical protein
MLSNKFAGASLLTLMEISDYYFMTRSGKEMNRRQEMLKNLSTKVNQMASALNMFSAANRENLLGPDSKTDDVINRASGFDNQGLVGFQRQIMRGMLSKLVLFFFFCFLCFSNYAMQIHNLFCIKKQNKMKA